MPTRPSALKATFLATALIAAATSGASAQMRNCVDTLVGMRELSRFSNGVVVSHSVRDLRGANAITIFAPTNEALSRLSQVTVDRLFPMEDSARQADNLEAPAAVGAHVLQGRRDAAALGQGGQFSSVAGTPLNVSASGGVITVTGADNAQARVTRADIACSNGVIHVIDAPLIR